MNNTYENEQIKTRETITGGKVINIIETEYITVNGQRQFSAEYEYIYMNKK